MIDTSKPNPEELADVVMRVQNRTGYVFDVWDIYDVARHTVRKADLNGKDEAYVPILFENELEDFLMRAEINEMGRINLCARFAEAALA